jgi:hypothetical protein
MGQSDEVRFTHPTLLHEFRSIYFFVRPVGTTETQKTQRLHREELCRYLQLCLRLAFLKHAWYYPHFVGLRYLHSVAGRRSSVGRASDL